MEHALDRPVGLRGMIVANSPASIPLWVEEANRLRADLPPDVQETLLRHEAEGTTDTPEYEAAVMVFYERHLCRVPWPECMTRAFAKMDEDPTVYHTMNGPSEFHCIGSLKDWDITDRLPEIDIPTLLISGEFDEATPKVVKAVADRIPNSEWVLFEGASHSTHIEAPEFSQTAVCVDKKRQWKRAKNIWKNSAMRSGLYMIGAPFRLITKPFKKKPKAGA